jgi:hypothetical protein
MNYSTLSNLWEWFRHWHTATGGDLAKSGELGSRMFDIPANILILVLVYATSGPLHRPSPSTHSGPLSQLQYSGLLVGPSLSRFPSMSSLGSAKRVVKQTMPTVKESNFMFGTISCLCSLVLSICNYSCSLNRCLIFIS